MAKLITKTKPVDTAKLAAKPTKSLPAGMTVAKPKAVSSAMGGKKSSSKKVC